MRAGVVALALLGLGEAAPAAFPVHVALEVDGAALTISVDGQVHRLESAFGGGWQRVEFEQPGPLEREYQIDGSDTTATNDRNTGFLLGLIDSPLYAINAWLRDEASYSRWEHISVIDLTTQTPAQTTEPLPNRFRIEAVLRRPEAPARIWLVAATDTRRQELVRTSDTTREGLELDRDHRNARWLIQRGALIDALPRWFFPEQPWPLAASLLHLLGRSVMAGYVLAVVAQLLPTVVRRRGMLRMPGEMVAEVVLAAWLLAAGLVVVRVYRQMPHVLDAVSYSFQAGVFASGALWAEAPVLEAALRGPFEVVFQGRWFSQYPPGAAAFYALGRLVGLDWVIGPVACTLMLAATWWTAKTLYGKSAGLVVLGLGALSPFVLFMSGSFLSHPIAGALLSTALAAFVAGERSKRLRWYAVAGGLLGVAFMTREVASVLFALPLVARLMSTRQVTALGWMTAAGAPFALVYLGYNALLTGSPWLLPRALFDPSDRFGFGDGFGFHRRHTLAAGLANTDELLTLLQFDLFGWPALFSFALVSVPFLMGKVKAWDFVALGGLLAFVVAYAAYFYHGVALGPRYYFEAVPWLLLLAGRGAQILAQQARSQAAVALLLAALSLNTVLFYLPAQAIRRSEFAGLPDGRRAAPAFVRVSLSGPRLSNVPAPALVLTNDWWLFNAVLSPLNCPRLATCPVVFALATGDSDLQRLLAEFPGRVLLHVEDHDGRLDIEPGAFHNPGTRAAASGRPRPRRRAA